jgi:hypothetical protein
MFDAGGRLGVIDLKRKRRTRLSPLALHSIARDLASHSGIMTSALHGSRSAE